MNHQRTALIGLFVAGLIAPFPADAAGDRGRGRRHVGVERARVVRAAPAVVARRTVRTVVRPIVPVRVVRPIYRPYYSFRPRVSIHIGLRVGYPVPYPYHYVYPTVSYPYASPYAYGGSYPVTSYPAPAYRSAYPDHRPAARMAAAQNGVVVSPPASGLGTTGAATAAYGGMSFAISPEDAQVLVDGEAVGNVRDFSPTSAPLTLTPGTHHIDIHSPGHRTMSFDVSIVAGQVIPYEGSLESLRVR